MSSNTTTPFPWRSAVGLVLIWVATLYNWTWLWGLLFLFWVIPDLITGTTYFIEPVSKANRPFMYWAIVLSWLIMAVYMMASFFWPELMTG